MLFSAINESGFFWGVGMSMFSTTIIFTWATRQPLWFGPYAPMKYLNAPEGDLNDERRVASLIVGLAGLLAGIMVYASNA